MRIGRGAFYGAAVAILVATASSAAADAPGRDGKPIASGDGVVVRITGTATVVESNLAQLLDSYAGIDITPSPAGLHSNAAVGTSHSFSYAFQMDDWNLFPNAWGPDDANHGDFYDYAGGVYYDGLSMGYPAEYDYADWDDYTLTTSGGRFLGIARSAASWDVVCTWYSLDTATSGTHISISSSVVSSCGDQGFPESPDYGELVSFNAHARSEGTIEHIYVNGAEAKLADYFAIAAPDSIAAVPEPASWALLLAGFGLVGLARRRKARPGERSALS